MSDPQPGAPSPSILLVEDDASTRLLLMRHLRKSGYDVTAFEAAEELIAHVRDRPEPPDVVISDVHLPGMSGIDLASFLLMQRPTQPIVLVTGDPDEALARDALSRGPVSYLLKPFELFELDSAVRQSALRTQAIARAVGNGLAPALGWAAPAESRGAPAGESGGWAAPAESRGAPAGESDGSAAPAAFAPGQIPAEWLAFVDERSYAGPGHADRVARVAGTLLSAMPDLGTSIDAEDLTLAARTHEIGRIDGPTANPADMAVQGAMLLTEAGFPDFVVATVRHLHERWDGTGGPDRIAGDAIPPGSLILAAADSIDHYCSAWMQAGMKPLDAVDRAIGLVTVQQSTVFSPVVAAAVHRERAAIRSICAAVRAAATSNAAV